MAEVEELVKRLQSHKGVLGIIVTSNDGIPIRSTMDTQTTVHYAGLINSLTAKTRSTIREIDPTNDLQFVRVRTRKSEIMIAPDKEYQLVVIQTPNLFYKNTFIKLEHRLKGFPFFEGGELLSDSINWCIPF